MQTEDLYLCPENLYRLGNAAEPKLTNVRDRDIDMMTLNGIAMIVANGKGISLFTKERLDRSPMGGWVWKISRNTPLPLGLKLHHDRPGHYVIAPTQNMPVDEYKGRLSKLALHCQKLYIKQVAK